MRSILIQVLTQQWEDERALDILLNLCYFNVSFFDLKHRDIDLSAFKHFSGLK